MTSVSTHRSFQDVSYAQSIGNLAQIAFGVRPVLHHRGSANDFELGHLGQVIEDFILDTVTKIGVIFICADVLEG